MNRCGASGFSTSDADLRCTPIVALSAAQLFMVWSILRDRSWDPDAERWPCLGSSDDEVFEAGVDAGRAGDFCYSPHVDLWQPGRAPGLRQLL
jgi:hypothetical protein